MATSIVCDIEQCKYNFDVHCTRTGIVIRKTAISGLPRYPTCITFCQESSHQANAADGIKLSESQADRHRRGAGGW